MAGNLCQHLESSAVSGSTWQHLGTAGSMFDGLGAHLESRMTSVFLIRGGGLNDDQNTTQRREPIRIGASPPPAAPIEPVDAPPLLKMAPGKTLWG